MDSLLTNSLINAGGASLVCMIFVWYLVKKDKADGLEKELQAKLFAEALQAFNGTLKEYLQESIKVKAELAQQLQHIADVLMYMERRFAIKNSLLRKKGAVEIRGEMKI